MDHMNKHLFDWIAIEDPNGDAQDDNIEEEDEVDSNLGDFEDFDHEEVDEVVSMKRARSVNENKENFLSIFCPNDHNDVDDGAKIALAVGMKFTHQSELKYCFTNYIVKHEYDPWYETNNSIRLLVRCCKGRDPTCPFRPWTSWMKKERTFQIKFLQTIHNCYSALKLGSIVLLTSGLESKL